MFYHSILQENQDSLLYKFLQSQKECPVKGDWILDVQKNLSELEIDDKMDQIKKMSKFRFHTKISKAVKKKAFEDLVKIKNKHSKVKDIEFSNFKMQGYLKSKLLSNQEAKFLFHSRCRMLPVRCNYGSSYTEHCCPMCNNLEDSQSHLLLCEALEDQNVIASKVPEYYHLFSSNIEDQAVLVKILKKKLEKRKKLLKTRS